MSTRMLVTECFDGKHAPICKGYNGPADNPNFTCDCDCHQTVSNDTQVKQVAPERIFISLASLPQSLKDGVGSFYPNFSGDPAQFNLAEYVRTWRPIETCPDDTTVLFWDKGPRIGRMEHDCLRMDNTRQDHFWGDEFDDDDPPTLWMPIPAATALEASANQKEGMNG